MIALTGAGAARGVCDPLPFLKSRKSRKFMGLQDDLAVVATGRALASAHLTSERLGERAGLFLAVGYIPFLEADIAPVLAASMNEDRFDVRRFGAGGFQKAHPLLTFRCLPNMPAYHVSASFDVQGPYLVTYPGPGQLYAALDEARHALEAGLVDVALVGAVAAQSNFLVQHHFARIEPPLAATALVDVAAVIVLERNHADAQTRRRGHLESVAITYDPPDLARYAAPGLAATGDGAAGLVLELARRVDEDVRGAFHHVLTARDGTHAASTWVLE